MNKKNYKMDDPKNYFWGGLVIALLLGLIGNFFVTSMYRFTDKFFGELCWGYDLATCIIALITIVIFTFYIWPKNSKSNL